MKKFREWLREEEAKELNESKIYKIGDTFEYKGDTIKIQDIIFGTGFKERLEVSFSVNEKLTNRTIQDLDSNKPYFIFGSKFYIDHKEVEKVAQKLRDTGHTKTKNV